MSYQLGQQPVQVAYGLKRPRGINRPETVNMDPGTDASRHLNSGVLWGSSIGNRDLLQIEIHKGPALTCFGKVSRHRL